MSCGLLTVNGETEICLKMHVYAHRSRLVGRGRSKMQERERYDRWALSWT